jgi:penicillin-binding protein 1A
MPRQRRQRRRARNRAGAPQVFLIGIAAALGLGVAGVCAAVLYVASVLGSTVTLRSIHPLLLGTPSEVFAANGTRLGFIQAETLRTPIGWKQLPEDLRNATVAIEDQRFYQNDGIDLTAILRAAIDDLTHGETLQGASTITMQLIRNLYLGNDLRTFKQKVTEAKLAVEYTHHHTKREILNDYLNDVPYGTVGGQTALGVQAAARVFFNKEASQLNLQQSALLAGLPQAPTSYNPFISPRLATERRNTVLEKMAQLRYITRAQARATEQAPLELTHSNYYAQRKEGFFFEYVHQQLVERYGARTVEYGGLKVYTTINLAMQGQARRAIEAVLPDPGDPAAAIVSIDPRTGYIRAMAESPQYEKSQFNLAADAHRQAGSTFKLFVLLTALRQGVDPYSTYYTSRPLDFVDPHWGPINIRSYSGSLGANYDIATAFLQSNDPIFTLLDLDLGPPNVKRTTQLAGIKAPLEGIPAEALGGLRVGVTPLEMADAYATVADGGLRDQPLAITKVVFPDGRVERLGTPRRTQVFSSAVTAEATRLLQNYITEGLGTAANYGCTYSAGKTGTTDQNTDAWFVGFTAHLSTAVWIGFPQGKISMNDVQGVTVEGPNLPAQMWHDYMEAATAGECTPFPSAPPLVFAPFLGKYQASGPSAPEPSVQTEKHESHKGHQHPTPVVTSPSGGGKPQDNGGPTTPPTNNSNPQETPASEPKPATGAPAEEHAHEPSGATGGGETHAEAGAHEPHAGT